MCKHAARKLALVVLLALLTGTADRAFASSTGPITNSSSTSAASSASTPDGVTGTDPEPIEPNIVSIVLTLLSLA